MMQCNYVTLGCVIRQVRKRRKLSQEVLSGLSGIGRSHLSEIESGQREAQLDTYIKIAQALDMPLSELVRMAEDTSAELTNH